jgi:hypothetical protein
MADFIPISVRRPFVSGNAGPSGAAHARTRHFLHFLLVAGPLPP